MGLKYLLDSNVIIGFLANKLPAAGMKFVSDIGLVREPHWFPLKSCIFFGLKPCKNAVSKGICSETEVSEQLYCLTDKLQTCEENLPAPPHFPACP